MDSVFVIGLFLLYFWYMFQRGMSFPISRPNSTPPTVPSKRTFQHSIIQRGNLLHFQINPGGTWTIPIPDSVSFRNNRLYARDACHNKPDGVFVLADGPALYDYVLQDRLQPPVNSSFDQDVKTMLQHGDSFFFVCKDGVISQLKQCLSGHVFRNGRCSKIDACTGRDDGVLFPHPLDQTLYYECQGQGSVLQTCPDNQWFMHDACRPKDDTVYYCLFFTEPLRINDTTYIKCRNSKPDYFTCPPGTRLFDKFECESTECGGKPDGFKYAMKLKSIVPFRFYPGYVECFNEKVNAVTCPKTWDHSLAGDENLTHLPMVFDGNTCSVPKICKNVQVDHNDVVVPSFQFTRRVRNWKWASMYDSLSGYMCEETHFNANAKRVTANFGETINPKRFKLESACVGSIKTVPLPDYWNYYYDCLTKKMIKCEPGKIYEPEQNCIKQVSNAHKLENYPLFQFDSLSQTGWIPPFNYSNEKAVSCSDPETEKNDVYNICSHPDCKAFPFLSQIPNFSIKRDRSECIFEPATRRIVKRNISDRYNFWSQRLVPKEAAIKDECVPLQKIQSGNFLLDSILYVTCKEAQPFVFCPSPLTKGIERIDNTFACVPPRMAVVDIGQQLNFEPNEIEMILPVGDVNAADSVILNRKAPQLIGNGITIAENERISIKGKGLVQIQFRLQNTYPPHVVWNKGQLQLSNFEPSAYLLKRKDFTRLPINFPTYKVAESAPSFLQD